MKESIRIAFFSIEKLSCCYFPETSDGVGEERKRDELLNIEEAMRRLDELWDGNDFGRGDKMRINVVGHTLMRIPDELLGDE